MASLDKNYQPKESEEAIYRLWESSGVFEPKSDQQPFVVVLPPPNANADLHCGHALDFQLKDILARWHRLEGRTVLLLPGADHAGFETWSVYEKHLAQKGQSRFDFSRQELYQQVWQFVQDQKGNMTNQIRRLGISCDWSRFVFSLDDKVVAAAKNTFQKMWQEDLIYRGRRLVNYCPTHATSFADIEVSYSDKDGHLWYINYPLVDDDQTSITVATTRPETMLGDTAVAVNPDDKRWQQLIGRQVQLPISQRAVPIIADRAVVSEFGTGAVKVTPGHDFADDDIGQRHQLEIIDLLDDNDQISSYDWLPAKYHGQTMVQARQLVVDDLAASGRLQKTKKHSHRVAECYKCQTPIEPRRRPQWFVRMQPLVKPAIAALKANQIKFYPDRKRHELIAYLEQLRDWNISRQIVWGIPIPVAQNINQPDDWIFDDRQERTDLVVDDQTYRPDPDVFDTWWSSGHWPWVSLDWPDQPAGYYPNSLMETGQDILRQWVGRMICLGLYATGEVPFQAVALHGMVTDHHGAKMSKSKGNVINPIEVIDDYGSDAVRLALHHNFSLGQPQSFSLTRVKAGANFCNKLWNIGRYIQTATNQATTKNQTAADHWINFQLEKTKTNVANSLQNYRFGEALEAVWQFVWHRLADWYIESTKWQLNRSNLESVWRQTLCLVHPWAPFVSEKLWQETIAKDNPDLLADQLWQSPPASDANQVKNFDRLVEVVGTIRTLLAWLDRPQVEIKLLHDSSLANYHQLLAQLTKLPVEVGQPTKNKNSWPLEIGPNQQAWLQISPDQQQALMAQLTANQKRHQAEINNLKQRLANQDYVDRAPAAIVQASRQRLKSAQKEIANLTAWLGRLQ